MINIQMLILLHISLFILSAYFTCRYIQYAHHVNWFDVPNERSSHEALTPRGGGLVFISLWVIVLITSPLFAPSQLLLILLPGCLIVAVTGFLDDRYSLSARYRAILYVLAAILAVFFLGGFDQISISEKGSLSLSWVGSFFAVLAISWSTNLFNFMDGTDGIAAMEALFVLVFGGSFLFLSGATDLGVLASTLAACIAGFFIWNRPVAKLFMGDVGSASLGFIILVLALIGEQLYGVSFLLWMILYMAFILDATMTLIRRILAGEKWYQAHRLHAYQRLNQAGLSHSKVLVAYMAVNLFLSVIAVTAFIYPNSIILMLFLSITVIFVLYCLVERFSPMYVKSHFQ